MSRRQALGVISNQMSNNVHQATNNHQFKAHPLKSHPSYTSGSSNDENEYPMGMVTKKSDFDFEIFQEEYESKKIIKQQIRAALTEKTNEPVTFSNDYDDEEEEERQEDEEYEDEDEIIEDDEEGICRLKYAALNSELDEKLKKKANDSDLNIMMDSSNLEQNSPMVLDDTIKFSSSSDRSELLEEEDDEEVKKLQIIEERENLLVNCDEYKDEILNYMRQEELENRAKPNYMKKQQDITGSMRSILVDWLVEVSEEYKLNVETLYLAVNYTDRFLSQMSVLRGKLQLVGTAGMYIAAKYEEISPPDVTEFVYITDDTYTKKQVLRMEHLLLKVLDFRMNTPTINCFLTHFLRFLKMTKLNTSEKVESLARYLAELTLIESETYLSFLPSQIAASAIYLSMYTLGKKWTKEIAEQIGYDYDLSELKECIIAMHKSMQQASSLPQQAIQEKYKSNRFQNVAQIEAPKSLQPFIYQ